MQNLLLKYLPFCTGVPRPVAVYPLSRETKGKDRTKTNRPGELKNIGFARGPFGKPGTAIKFKGRANSFILFPNKKGGLDTKNAITILAWVKPKGATGPIFNYHPNAWGVHLWIIRGRGLFVRYTRRKDRKSSPHLVSYKIKRNRWNYIGTTYDRRTGIASLFINRRPVVRRFVGKFPLSTQFPVRMGTRQNDKRFFKGSISCLQVFNVALRSNQILAQRNECLKKRRK